MKRALQGLLFVACIPLVLSCSPRPAGPNIVLVVLDTVRRDFTRPFLFPDEPNGGVWADLAAEGTLFRAAWATAPWTVPSHASLFTGSLPSSHRCTSDHLRLGSEHETVAEILGRSGYETAAFHSNPWLTDELTGLLRGFQIRHASMFEWPQRPDHDQGGGKTIQEIHQWLSRRSDKRPFFLFVNFLEAHLPFNPPRWYREKELPDLASYDVITTGWANEWNAGLRREEDVDWDRVRRLYRGDVAFAEFLLEEVIALLESAGVYEECVVIVTSDHGENLGEHGLMDHQFGVHETLLAVPLLVRAPGRLEGGTRDDPVLLTDLFATLLDLAGIDGAAGRPHSRSLLGAPFAADRPLPAQYGGPPPTHRGLLLKINPGADMPVLGRAFATVRENEMRLTQGSDGTLVLHDLSSDRGQRRSVLSERSEIAEEMKRHLPPLPSLPHPEEEQRGARLDLDDDTAGLLRALGYAD